ncbi:MAG TPA: zinc-ribbon domain-containing protein [Gemmatimonadaceae bacterium]|nr:zinc-ribbon domain-containing protein [Gemmatimonadaceae bacterium]
MNVSCPECRSVFRVDPTKIPTAGVRARCSVCGGVITIGKGGAIENDFSDGRATAAPAARPTPRPQAPPPPRMPTPAPPTPGVAPFARKTPLTGSRPVTPPIPTPAAPRPSAPVTPPPTPRPSAPNVPGAARAPSQPSIPPRPQPAAATPVASNAPTPRVSVPAPSAPAAPSRSINPFLSNDPNVKAKRLARALVSDIVAYFPQKREEGLRNGTLKQLFREEIKKSYEEYVDQMGKEFAETTTHFQDALNEVLAGGKKLF